MDQPTIVALSREVEALRELLRDTADHLRTNVVRGTHAPACDTARGGACSCWKRSADNLLRRCAERDL